jgi:hypothetical protein
MEPLDLSLYPAAPVLWVTASLDTLCDNVGCSQWRSWAPASLQAPGHWLSEEFRLGHLAKVFPPMTSYDQYLRATATSQPSPSLASFQTWAFQTPSTTLADLSTPSALIALCLLVVLLRAIKAVLLPWFSSMGRTAGRATHGVEWEAANEVRIVKFGEYVFRLVFHSLISLAGIWYFWDKEWWIAGNTQTLWKHFPHQDVQPGMIWYYLVQSAYNLEAMLSLLELSFTTTFRPLRDAKSKYWQFPLHIAWSPTVRGDFREMFVHHVITNLLVLGSSFFRLTRVGSMVFLVHDISDVPVDMSKLANFLKWKAMTAACFAAMVIVWCMTRLGALPFVIYKSILLESWMVCVSTNPDSNSITGVDALYFVCYRHFFYVATGLLIVLHLAWFTMFLQMGWVLVRKGEAHDLSEHKTGEEQLLIDEKNKKRK